MSGGKFSIPGKAAASLAAAFLSHSQPYKTTDIINMSTFSFVLLSAAGHHTQRLFQTAKSTCDRGLIRGRPSSGLKDCLVVGAVNERGGCYSPIWSPSPFLESKKIFLQLITMHEKFSVNGETYHGPSFPSVHGVGLRAPEDYLLFIPSRGRQSLELMDGNILNSHHLR